MTNCTYHYRSFKETLQKYLQFILCYSFHVKLCSVSWGVARTTASYKKEGLGSRSGIHLIPASSLIVRHKPMKCCYGGSISRLPWRLGSPHYQPSYRAFSFPRSQEDRKRGYGKEAEMKQSKFNLVPRVLSSLGVKGPGSRVYLNPV